MPDHAPGWEKAARAYREARQTAESVSEHLAQQVERLRLLCQRWAGRCPVCTQTSVLIRRCTVSLSVECLACGHTEDDAPS